MAAVLSMQKLLRRYLYASSYPVEYFGFHKEQSGFYETLMLPALSTENTELVVANPDLSRAQKTAILAGSPLAQKHLYVCWKELICNKNTKSEIAAVKDKVLNCTRCDKCRRTLITLDILGTTQKFRDIFDLPHWEKTRNNYIARVLFTHKRDAFSQDIVKLMEKHDFKIPAKARILEFMYRIHIMGLILRTKKMLAKV